MRWCGIFLLSLCIVVNTLLISYFYSLYVKEKLLRDKPNEFSQDLLDYYWYLYRNAIVSESILTILSCTASVCLLICTIARLYKFAQVQNGFFFEQKSIYLPQTILHIFLIATQGFFYILQASTEVFNFNDEQLWKKVFCVNVVLNGMMDIVLSCWICTLIYDV
jgi:hypothetical protein